MADDNKTVTLKELLTEKLNNFKVFINNEITKTDIPIDKIDKIV